MHALRDCPKVKEVLELARVPTSVVNAAQTLTKEWIVAVADHLPIEGMCNLVVLLWNILNHMNRLVHEEELQDTRTVVDLASSLQADYYRAHATMLRVPIIKQAPRWRKPTSDTINLNIDVAFDMHMGRAAIGIVVRDRNGFVLAGRASMLEGSHTAETAEAYAFQEGVKLTLNKVWQQVVLEGDAIGIVHRLANSGLDLSTPAAILDVTQKRLRSNTEIKIYYVRREANMVAHNLAK
ncbi:hypothetical protein V6N13_081236 [Hibiscus sabdariffa]